ncbi:hypothetical protein DFP72DRAFT_1067706 [Ephemerocybe angulata]|uniref:Uncharacterized protein n=1 Tax=Ephemerocybe angulata TaxID=980116 RepID=A0A8H6M749_9AGAR|nr:hypothetical protein DFP72DRAFT_1067706 [Tulosesus angulatus]
MELDPVVLMTVKDEHYSMESDSDWESLFPNGFSIAPITPNSGPAMSSTATTKVPSVYNQLWCLNQLRKAYMRPGWENDQCRDKQVHRCLNLLRQGILCNGDTTLEPTITVDHQGAKVTGASGYDVKHVCRDWTKVRAATEQRLVDV